jgi:hypothetical protein
MNLRTKLLFSYLIFVGAIVVLGGDLPMTARWQSI